MTMPFEFAQRSNNKWSFHKTANHQAKCLVICDGGLAVGRNNKGDQKVESALCGHRVPGSGQKGFLSTLAAWPLF